MLSHSIARLDDVDLSSCVALQEVKTLLLASEPSNERLMIPLNTKKKRRPVSSLLCSLLAAFLIFFDRWFFVPILWALDRSIPFGLTLLRIKQATAVGRQLDLRLRTLRRCAAQWNVLSPYRSKPWRHNPVRQFPASVQCVELTARLSNYV